VTEPLCRDCQELQIERKATRLVVKTPVCDEHMAKRLGQKYGGLTIRTAPAVEKPAERAEDPLKKYRIEQSTVDEIKRRAAEGMKISAIAEETGVSYMTVRKYAIGEATRAKAKPGPKGIAKANGGTLAKSMAGLLRKWNEEADAVFAALPLERKAALLGSLEA
jgi:hypothetical protein